MYTPDISDIKAAADHLNGIAVRTPLVRCESVSKEFNSNIYFKREDLQVVRSYKIRGAYNKIRSLSASDQQKSIVCASAGNHAQGVAYSCQKLKIRGTIYMPGTTPKQKIRQVEMFGKGYIDIVLQGDTFDDAYSLAMEDSNRHGKVFVHPFDDEKIIEGQATVGLEIVDQAPDTIDYVILPVGGGGLASGVSTVFHNLSPETAIIGVEPKGAPSMKVAFKRGKPTKLKGIDKFVDGAAVQCVGRKTFDICSRYLKDIITVPEGAICQTILDLYNTEAIVIEPAGALSISVLSQLRDVIKGKNVVCIVSGSNNEISRMAEIRERALLHSKIKHYFIVQFPQRAGALREFVVDVLGPDDDIVYFEYQKKLNKENGPAVVGVELKSPEDLTPLINRLKSRHFFKEYLNDNTDLMNLVL